MIPEFLQRRSQVNDAARKCVPLRPSRFILCLFLLRRADFGQDILPVFEFGRSDKCKHQIVPRFEFLKKRMEGGRARVGGARGEEGNYPRRGSTCIR